MKAKNLLFIIFAIVAFNSNAQNDYSSYLEKAITKLEEGDCASAQKFYNVYMDLSGESKPSVQTLIDDCIKKSDEKKAYNIGDRITIKERTYKVAYIEDGGKHGFAVCEAGSGRIPEKENIPTWAEFKHIKNANKTLNLCGRYWSSRVYNHPTENGSFHFVYGLGGRNSSYVPDWSTHEILLIYHF